MTEIGEPTEEPTREILPVEEPIPERERVPAGPPEDPDGR